MWVIVILAVRLVAGPIVGKLLPKLVGQTDGFNASALLNTLLNIKCNGVLSLFTIHYWNVDWVAQISLEPFKNFLHICPRNFGVAG